MKKKNNIMILKLGFISVLVFAFISPVAAIDFSDVGFPIMFDFQEYSCEEYASQFTEVHQAAYLAIQSQPIMIGTGKPGTPCVPGPDSHNCRITAGGAQFQSCDCDCTVNPPVCEWSEWLPCPGGATNCENGHCAP